MHLCSEQSGLAGENAIGTASGKDTFLLIESAFPWGHNVLQTKDIAALAPELMHIMAEYSSLKILLVGYDTEYSRKGFRRVLHMQKNEMGGYDGFEYFLPQGKEAELLLYVLTQPELLTPYTGCVASRTILVCVDGGHDKCCGLKGQPLYREMRQLYGNDYQVLQSSHIGGHRFAPTFIDFPEGRVWGKVDTSLLASILEKSGDFSSVSDMYRGNCRLSKEEQYVEKALLEMYGWAALDCPLSFVQATEEKGIHIVVHFSLEEQPRTHTFLLIEGAPYVGKGSCKDETESSFSTYTVQLLSAD